MTERIEGFDPFWKCLIYIGQFLLLLLPLFFSRGHATLHLPVSICRSVSRSVGRSVRPSVTFLNSERFLHYCSCPTVCDWIAVYPALFSSLSFLNPQSIKNKVTGYVPCLCPTQKGKILWEKLFIHFSLLLLNNKLTNDGKNVNSTKTDPSTLFTAQSVVTLMPRGIPWEFPRYNYS